MIKYKLIKEDLYRNVYVIDTDVLELSGKTFQLKKSLSNLSSFLNKMDTTLIEFLNSNLSHNRCLSCDDEITKNRYERNKFITYKFCDKCNKRNIKNKYKKVKCVVCNKTILHKDVIFSTCGDNKCIDTHREKINNSISKTHWTTTDNNNKIEKKRIKKRKENDKKYNRIYVPWNKGKTGIYSKETIEKLRNAAIKQMKEGRIKKTGQEKIFENFLINNNINYTYSFIYKKRQFDFLLHDYNLVVELQGDYWHGNPKFWDVYDNDSSKKKLYETQIMKKKDDVIKKKNNKKKKLYIC
jgi:hypothetical protein